MRAALLERNVRLQAALHAIVIMHPSSAYGQLLTRKFKR